MCTCSEHARVRVCGGETQVLLDATAWAFADFLEGKILWLLYHLPAVDTIIINVILINNNIVIIINSSIILIIVTS